MASHTVARTSEVSEDAPIHREVAGIDIAVFQVGEEYYAVQNRCPHKGAPLHLGDLHHTLPIQEGDTRVSVHCPWHSMEIDLATGDCPATGHSTGTFEVRIDGDEIRVEL